MHRATALALLLVSCKPQPPAPASPPKPPEEQKLRIEKMIQQLTALDMREDDVGHGPCHKIKPDIERELWPIVSTLPVVEGGDRILIRALEEVYAGHLPNYWHGYIFHYPYLNSKKAIALAGKLVREYPDSDRAPLALWLKAFAYRVRAPDERQEMSDSYGDQPQWIPDPDKAMSVYRDLAVRYPQSLFADKARAKMSRPVLVIELPVGPLPEGEDPRQY
jgi:hypothetical protein